MVEAVACRHVQEGVEAALTIGIGGVPVSQCALCLQRMDRYIHLSLTSRNADPSQGHDNPPGGMIGLEAGAAPLVVTSEQHDESNRAGSA